MYGITEVIHIITMTTSNVSAASLGEKATVVWSDRPKKKIVECMVAHCDNSSHQHDLPDESGDTLLIRCQSINKFNIPVSVALKSRDELLTLTFSSYTHNWWSSGEPIDCSSLSCDQIFNKIYEQMTPLTPDIDLIAEEISYHKSKYPKSKSSILLTRDQCRQLMIEKTLIPKCNQLIEAAINQKKGNTIISDIPSWSLQTINAMFHKNEFKSFIVLGKNNEQEISVSWTD